MRTTVINLFAGPGVGKSTLAAELFSEMKKKGLEVEMVREWVKLWAWQGKNPTFFDQFLLFGNQLQEEVTLHGKVEYLITDSPLLLPAFYEKVNFQSEYILPSAKAIMKKAEKLGIIYKNFLLKRTRPYKTGGRYQTEEQAKELDKKLINFLKKAEIDFKTIYGILDILKEI